MNLPEKSVTSSLFESNIDEQTAPSFVSHDISEVQRRVTKKYTPMIKEINASPYEFRELSHRKSALVKTPTKESPIYRFEASTNKKALINSNMQSTCILGSSNRLQDNPDNYGSTMGRYSKSPNKQGVNRTWNGN